METYNTSENIGVLLIDEEIGMYIESSIICVDGKYVFNWKNTMMVQFMYGMEMAYACKVNVKRNEVLGEIYSLKLSK